MKRYKAKLKSDDTDISKRWATGWYIEIEGISYIVLDDAEHRTAYDDSCGCMALDVIDGLVEVQKKTVIKCG